MTQRWHCLLRNPLFWAPAEPRPWSSSETSSHVVCFSSVSTSSEELLEAMAEAGFSFSPRAVIDSEESLGGISPGFETRFAFEPTYGVNLTKFLTSLLLSFLCKSGDDDSKNSTRSARCYSLHEWHAVMFTAAPTKSACQKAEQESGQGPGSTPQFTGNKEDAGTWRTSQRRRT